MLQDFRKALPGEGVRLHSLSYGPALESAIFGAKSRVFLSCYMLFFPLSGRVSQAKNLVDALSFRVKEHGLDVRLAMSWPKKLGSGQVKNIQSCYYLQRSEIPFRFSQINKPLHAKYVLVDNSSFFIGSHNFFDASFNNPLELTLELMDHPSIELFAKSFDAFWQTLIIAPFVDGVSWHL